VLATSDVLGVYVRSTGTNQRGEMVVDYCRWVMVRKRDEKIPPPEPVVPELPEAVDGESAIPGQRGA
jgi:2-methylfumaryl-CoA hydratase